MSRRVGSSLPSRWQDGFCVIHSSSKARVLLIAAGNAFLVLELLYRLSTMWMPYQFELNEVPPFATHSNYSIKTLLHDNFADAFMLEWCSIFTKDLSRLTV
jgi:hypothetical protein